MPSSPDGCCCSSCDEGRSAGEAFHGLVQHSFALHSLGSHVPLYGETNLECLSKRFKTGDCTVHPVGELKQACDSRNIAHSPLAQAELTTIGHCRAQYLVPVVSGPRKKLPLALSWAESAESTPASADLYEDPNLIFADAFDDDRVHSVNDFLVRQQSGEPGEEISQLFLELMAHKRSRLFGFALANRIVTLMLPHAILEPSQLSSRASPGAAGEWFMQPLISLIRGGTGRRNFRRMYALTLFLLPVEDRGNSLAARLMTPAEMKAMVNPGWGFAAAPPPGTGTYFKSPESLLEYLSEIARLDMAGIGPRLRRQGSAAGPSQPDGATLRQIAERVAFGVGLTLAQGEGGLGEREKRHIGNAVITSLGSARVSSLVVVDKDLKPGKIKKPVREEPFPGALLSLMNNLACPARSPKARDRHSRKYRLDRPFVDSELYAIGVLPTKRCLVVTSSRDAQYGVRESAFMQAGSIAHMTIGAATAIGTMREIDRRLEFLEDADEPRAIAKIDAEIASDLAEIYDLDITRESYRAIYQRLRDRLGITRDYVMLQGKMEMLYRATSTFHARKSERLLVGLTAAIVALSVLILIGTIIVAGKHGG